MRKASKLRCEERSEIQILGDKGYSARSIAKALGRSPNTIAGEIKRNRCGFDGRTALTDQGRYIAARAKQKAYVRRKYARYQGKKIQENDKLRSFIIQKLQEHWNPDEIAGFLKANSSYGFYASKTAIYEWLRSAHGQPYCEHLYSRRYHCKPRKTKQTERVLIPERIGIGHRPTGASNRTRYGHWEQDAVVSGKKTGSKAALSVLQERKSRYVYASLTPNLKPAEHLAPTKQLTANAKVLSVTYDNGVENRDHTKLRQQGIGTSLLIPTVLGRKVA